ncbi:MAG: ribose transport system permease protein, partial [Chloroflexota bacterium]|nr:ribose transport system permease protein [Chloroflexota bacterium]
RYGTLAALVVMIAGFGILSPKAFLSGPNLINVLNQAALLAIVAGGLTFPLIAGQFDLSFATLVSLAGILVIGLMTNQGLPWFVAVPVVIVVGGLIGFVNGVIVTAFRVSSIVTTLGMSTIIVGLNYAYSNGIPIPLGAQARGGPFVELAQGRLFGIPYPVFFMAGILVALWVLLNRTRFGHHAQAIGSNPTAAALSGVRVSRITIGSFVIASACAAVAGILLSARIGSGQVTAGDGFLLSTFAAVFLGASVLRDREFHIIGSFIGVLFVAIGFNGLSILGAPTHVQFFFQGGVLIIATALSTATARRTELRR